MKKLYLFLSVIITIVFMERCDDVLDLSPVSSVTDANFWKTPEQFETFMTGIHSRLRTHAFNMEVLGEFRADIYGETSDGSIVFERYHQNTLNAQYTGLTRFAGFYTNINQINLFISKTLSTDLLPETDKEYYLGQAYGLRAFYYFHLLRSWGDVVITRDPSTSFDFDKLSQAAAPAADVMNFIKQDIDSSIYHFGNNYSFQSKFWSKPATLMLKSEVYLWSSKRMGGGTTDASVAKAALTDIQTNIPSMNLLPNFEDVFAYSNKGNKEIIFALRYNLNEYNFLGGNYTQFLRRYVSVANYYDSIEARKLNTTDDLILNIGGSHYVAVHVEILRKFSNDDSRKRSSIRAAYTMKDGQYVFQSGCWVAKYKGVFDLGNRELVDDWPIYRYAELLLNLAEAKSILGEDPTSEINLIRQRAYAANYQEAVHGYPNQPLDGDINEALLHERLLEFICEGKRWYDLIRFGNNYVFKYTTATDDYQLLWPIDVGALTDNKALVQNPGY